MVKLDDMMGPQMNNTCVPWKYQWWNRLIPMDKTVMIIQQSIYGWQNSHTGHQYRRTSGPMGMYCTLWHWSGSLEKSQCYLASIHCPATIGLQVKRHLYGVLLVGRWWSAFSVMLILVVRVGQPLTKLSGSALALQFHLWVFLSPTDVSQIVYVLALVET